MAAARLVAMGRPEDVIRVTESHTGRWLAPMLARSAPVREAPAASDSKTSRTASRKLKAG